MGLKKYKGALTYPVGLGTLHDCTIFKKWSSMSNACIVMWCNFGQNVTTGLFFPLMWVSSVLYIQDTDGASGCWFPLSGETQQMKHSTCVSDLPVWHGCPGAPCSRDV